MLRDDEIEWLNAQDRRCDGCGHLCILHVEDECEPVICSIDGCDCIDGRNAQQREEDARKRDEIMAQRRENAELRDAFLRRMQLDSRYAGKKILWAHDSLASIGMAEVAWLRGPPSGDCFVVVPKGLERIAFPYYTDRGFGTLEMVRTSKTHEGVPVFE